MKLGIGSAQFGMQYGINNSSGVPSKDEIFSILDCAIQSGIDCIDTAAAYGESEAIIGEYFSDNNHSRIKVATKIPSLAEFGTAALNHKVVSELEKSIKRLKVDKINYCLLHDASDMLRLGRELIYILSDAKKKGLVELFGVSVYTAKEFDECLKYDEIGVVQIPFNLFDRRMIKSDTVRILRERGTELHIRSVFLQGLLLMDKVPDCLFEAQSYLSKFHGICQKYELTPKELAFCYVRDDPNVDRFFIGCETVTQLNEIQQINMHTYLDKAIIEEIEATLVDVPERILNPSLWGK